MALLAQSTSPAQTQQLARTAVFHAAWCARCAAGRAAGAVDARLLPSLCRRPGVLQRGRHAPPAAGAGSPAVQVRRPALQGPRRAWHACKGGCTLLCAGPQCRHTPRSERGSCPWRMTSPRSRAHPRTPTCCLGCCPRRRSPLPVRSLPAGRARRTCRRCWGGAGSCCPASRCPSCAACCTCWPSCAAPPQSRGWMPTTPALTPWRAVVA